MTNHDATCSKSTKLCGQLFDALQQKIPDLKMKNGGDWYSLWSTGTVIAWVSRVKIWGGIRVWFVGDSEFVKKISVTAITPRMTPITGTWGDCCGSFKISNEAQLQEAVELLSIVSSNESMAFKTRWQPADAYKKTKAQRSVPDIYTTLAGRQF